MSEMHKGEIAGEVFSIAANNQPVPGCTMSEAVRQEDGASVVVFSLAAHTDISAELYEYYKLIHVEQGELVVYLSPSPDGESGAPTEHTLGRGEVLLTPTGVPVGMRTESGCVYTEIEVRKDSAMNEILKSGNVFKLADLLPYQDGKIVNMDLAHNDKMKFVLMSFDEGTGLSEHAAPGEALIFALEGEGTIGYEGQEHTISAGQNFKFAKGGKHYVKAESGRFKMALLITLE